MNKLTCTGKDAVTRIFDYTVTTNHHTNEWTYKVRSVPPPESGEFFELTVKAITDDEVRVIAMYNNRDEVYQAKGIPDALLPLISSDLERSVCSSPTRGIGNIYRTQDAGKVWDRLVKSGKAEYVEVDDVYRICYP
ncbi:hypothetical protein C5610_10800 [Idiomarina sp. OT37-5b]|nr:hypothetical protein C5610_10800 [Idiomarina sp. OT37-5b]